MAVSGHSRGIWQSKDDRFFFINHSSKPGKQEKSRWGVVPSGSLSEDSLVTVRASGLIGAYFPTRRQAVEALALVLAVEEAA